jgi:hypothetical protein
MLSGPVTPECCSRVGLPCTAAGERADLPGRYRERGRTPTGDAVLERRLTEARRDARPGHLSSADRGRVQRPDRQRDAEILTLDDPIGYIRRARGSGR